MSDEVQAPAGSAPTTADQLIRALEGSDTTQVTDTANGQLYAETLHGVVRYVVDEDRWLTWNGNVWQRDAKTDVKALALTRLVIDARRDQAIALEDDAARERALRNVAALEGVRKRTDILRAASLEPRLQLDGTDLDATDADLVVANGTVNLDTGELRPSRPDDLNSRACVAAYVGEAGLQRGYAPELDLFEDTFIPDPQDRRYVYALLGYALRGGNPRRLFPIFWGPTTTGKSQLFVALDRLLGDYASAIGPSVFRGNLDDRPRPDMVNAMPTRLAVASEASEAWALHADQVKRLTGGEPLPYRNLHAGVVKRVPRFTPVVVCNEFPRITGADAATKKRIIAVHLDRELAPGKEDPAVKQRFMADPRTYEGLLARLVAGAVDDVLDDATQIPERYVLGTMKARASVDHLDAFIEWASEDNGYLVPVPPDGPLPASATAKASQLFGLYVHWATKYASDVEKRDRLGSKGFSQALRGRGWEQATSAGRRWTGWRLVLPLHLAMDGQ